MSRQGMVVLLRHAQSEWNVDKRFTGWGDPALTAQGRDEARVAGRTLATHAVRFDHAYCSMLCRTRQTLELVLAQLGQSTCPVNDDWRLNERHYGVLEGCDRASMIARYGEDQLAVWRRDHRARPPALDSADPRHPARDSRYRHVDPQRLPCSESLADAQERVLGFWNETGEPRLRAGENLLVVSHNNTLRTLACHLDGRPLQEIESITWPTAQALAYCVDATGSLRRVA